MKHLLSRRLFGLLALLVALAVVNLAVFQKERQLAHGKVVYLELAPVDPRSLMQGDYMTLSFAIGQDIRRAVERGGLDFSASEISAHFVIVTLDSQNRASFKALFNGQDLAPAELLLRFRLRHNRVHFATNAFFFQEGDADYYQAARYGQFRVNEQGEPLLVALYGDDLKRLGPPEKTNL
ncbi:MAG TPA: GDYXXLXY domain-containing protein [Marinobacter sp.]|nr:GDYXXLXY domain-containing protein [Marinobacter sp.]